MAIATLADVKRLWTGDKLRAQIERGAGRGVQAAAVFLVGRLKEVLSVPAPRKLVHGRSGSYYRATVPATPGAPPRKLSGKLRANANWRMIGKTKAKVGFNLKYAKPLEKRMGHAYLAPTAKKFRSAIIRIMVPRRGR